MDRIGRQKMIIVLVIVLFASVPEVSAKNHSVGGHPGWDDNFNMKEWLTGRLFQTGDNLVFQYGPEYNVLETDEKAYNTCMVNHWIASHNGGYTVVSLASAGTRYFLCGSVRHCKRGMRLRVDVVNNDDANEDNYGSHHPPKRSPPNPNSPPQTNNHSPPPPPPQTPHQPPPPPDVPDVPDDDTDTPDGQSAPAPTPSGIRPARNPTAWDIVGLCTLLLIPSVFASQIWSL